MKKLLLVLALCAPLFASSAHAQQNRFLTSVPADAPYVFATLQPMPEGLMNMMFESMDGFDKILQNAAREVKGKTPEDKMARALFSEFKGKFNRKGMESMGVSMTPHMAVYGLGPLPVMRIDLRDGKKFRAFFARVLKKGGVKATPKKSAGKEYFQFGDHDLKILVSIQQNEAAVAIASEKVLEQTLSHLLGATPVPNPMTDAKVLTEVMNKHKFTPYGVGYADFDLIFKGLQGQLTGTTGTYWVQIAGDGVGKLPAACKKEIGDDIKRFPRVVIGYDQLDKVAFAMSMVLEGDSSMVSAIKGITAEVPGFHPDLLSSARFAIGAAMKIPEAKKLGIRFADALAAIGKNCGENEFSEGASKIKTGLNESLPPQLTNSTGAYLVGINFDLPEQGMVENVAAYAGMQTKEPAAILAQLETLAEGQVKLKVPADGKFHAITVAMLQPFMDGMFLASDAKHIFLAAGTVGKASAEKSKAAAPRPSPFIYFGYDMAYIMKKLAPMMKGKPEAEALQSLAKFYKGPGAFWVWPSPHGLAMSARLSMQPSNN